MRGYSLVDIAQERRLPGHDFHPNPLAMVHPQHQQDPPGCQHLQQDPNELQNQEEAFPPTHGSIHPP